MSVLGHCCAWCESRIVDHPDGPFGLRTTYRKSMSLGSGEEKRVPISIAHLDRTVFGFVRRQSGHSGQMLDLTFRTCSHRCARILRDRLHFERCLFSAPLFG